MLIVEQILGGAQDPLLADRLHRLQHAGRVEYVRLKRADTARRRMRVETDRGRECGISLPRDSALFNGAVLHLAEDAAIVVRVEEERWLALAPTDTAAALEIGYHAGNLHWRVRFSGGRLLVALEGTPEAYLARLREHVPSSRYRWEVRDGGA